MAAAPPLKPGVRWDFFLSSPTYAKPHNRLKSSLPEDEWAPWLVLTPRYSLRYFVPVLEQPPFFASRKELSLKTPCLLEKDSTLELYLYQNFWNKHPQNFWTEATTEALKQGPPRSLGGASAMWSSKSRQSSFFLSHKLLGNCDTHMPSYNSFPLWNSLGYSFLLFSFLVIGPLD